MIAYLITNTVNGKRYVGISKHDSPVIRWREHVRRTRRKTSGLYLLQKAILKYGPQAFTIEHVASAKTSVDLRATEVTLIQQYGTFWSGGVGYNMTLGGDGGYGAIRSAATRAKLRAAHVGRRLTLEHRTNMSASQKIAQNRPERKAQTIAALRARLPPSDETRAKISAAHRGKRLSPEQIAKMAITLTGRKQSAETRAKRSAALVGREVSEEARLKISASQLGKIISPVTRAKLSEAAKTREVPGMLGKHHSAETLARLSASAKARLLGKVISAETRAKLSAASKRRKTHGMAGKHHSAEARARISASAKSQWTNRKLRSGAQ